MARNSVPVAMSSSVLDRLMPLHLRIDAEGRILDAGPTLIKLARGQRLRGKAFFNAFEVRRPAGIDDVATLTARAGERLHLALTRSDPQLTFRGLALPLSQGQGLILNMSFGIGVVDAVQAYALTDADFAPTDLTIEMLYLVEANSAVTDELKNLNRRLVGAKTRAENEALTDTLTGLANRRAVELFLADLQDKGEDFSLMHVDLDYFKAVNDTLGHAAGDHVLREVAKLLGRVTRTADLAARVGGDEFLLVFPGLLARERLHALAARLIEEISQPIVYQSQLCRISASIGLNSSGDYPREDIEQMLKDTDAALYASKRAGRGRASFRGVGGEPSNLGA